MEGLHELKERLAQERPVSWEGFPDIPLYMDQLISYMPRQLIQWERDALTPAMVNNYIKDGLLPRAEGKRYSRTHLAYLTAICALKQVLSVREVGVLLSTGCTGEDPEGAYTHFCTVLDAALGEAAEALDPEAEGGEALSSLALDLALRSYAYKLACQRVLARLQEGQPRPEKGKK